MVQFRKHKDGSSYPISEKKSSHYTGQTTDPSWKQSSIGDLKKDLADEKDDETAYRKQAKKAKTEKDRKTFTGIANDEADHQKKLNQMKADDFNRHYEKSEYAKTHGYKAEVLPNGRIQYSRINNHGYREKITFSEALSPLDGRDMREMAAKYSTSPRTRAIASRTNAMQKEDPPTRSKETYTYHGRTGHPEIHQSGDKEYIMVRSEGGGTKRLYLTPETKRQLESKEGYTK